MMEKILVTFGCLSLASISVCASVTTSRPAGNLALLGHQKLAKFLANHPAPYGHRSGLPSRKHSCDLVRSVPTTLRWGWVMRPSGISPFYKKYTEAYGIPVIGSGQVSDDALKRACYVLRFLLAGHSGLRYLYYKLYGRVAVIGWREKVTAIPEYSFLPDEWNDRSRGLGATETVPLSSGAEENLLCYVFHRDRYEHEDIFLHELTHGLHLLGAKYAIPGFQRDLDRFFKAANRSGRWSNTYSLQSSQEYLAEGAQIFYHVNAHSDPPDGIHGPIDTPEKLRDYDPDLYRLIKLMYPCNNTYIDRCSSSPELEREQVLQMDCDLTREYQFKLPKFTPEPCEDRNGHCPDWAVRGECQLNPSYMQKECRVSCHLCDKPLEADPTPSPATTGACIDSNTHCSSWADTGECDRNLAYMKDKCRFSCGIC